LLAVWIRDRPFTTPAAQGNQPRGFDVWPVLQPLFGGAVYLRWSAELGPSHSIVDEGQDRFEYQTGNFHRCSRTNGVWAFRLTRQMNMDGLHVEDGGAALSVPLGFELGGETVVCLRQGPEVGECCVSSADFVGGHDHYAIPFACECLEMNAINAVSEHEPAAIWLAP
jgi:hypothetical protein